MVQIHVRRGLPRVQGGPAWPPVDTVEVEHSELPAQVSAPQASALQEATGATEEVTLRQGLPRVPGGQAYPPVTAATVAVDADLAPAAPEAAEEPGDRVPVTLRRGLPRTPGAQPYPPVDEVLVAPAMVAPAALVFEQAEPAPTTSVAEPTSEQELARAPEATPAPASQTAETAAPRGRRKAPGGLLVGLGAFVLLVVAVVAARLFVQSETGMAFLERYSGQQPLPEGAPIGLPAWLGWAHFFNMFLMALIIRTGISVRQERKPEAYWAPRGAPRKKISLTLWLHLVVDILWVALGVVFYVLLFATGQWMRVVPTSWEVLPQALSAGIQYLSLAWPLENPWVHYNALQELSYFLVIFIASPLAIITGARMSPWWPKQWNVISLKLARSLHFPTMMFFVFFTIVHVVLVFFTGARRNLNAMFAASGDIDPAVYGDSWRGVAYLVAALVVIGTGVWLARGRFVAPLAQRTGNVTSR